MTCICITVTVVALFSAVTLFFTTLLNMTGPSFMSLTSTSLLFLFHVLYDCVEAVASAFLSLTKQHVFLYHDHVWSF